MKRKSALLIVTSLFLSLIFASSALAEALAPTAPMTVCFTLQGTRASGPSSANNEPNIQYTLTNTSSSAVTSGSDTAEVGAAPNACIETESVVEGSYDITIVSDDTLTASASNVPLAFSTNNATGITLIEGNAETTNTPNIITIDDFSVLSAQFFTPGPEADFDENGAVDIDDFSILSANFGASARSGAPERACGDVSDSFTLTISDATTQAGDMGSVEVTASRVGDTVVNGGRFVITYTSALIQVDSVVINPAWTFNPPAADSPGTIDRSFGILAGNLDITTQAPVMTINYTVLGAPELNPRTTDFMFTAFPDTRLTCGAGVRPAIAGLVDGTVTIPGATAVALNQTSALPVADAGVILAVMVVTGLALVSVQVVRNRD